MLLGNILHREQAFGEIRSLKRPQAIITDRMRELQLKLGLIKETTIQNTDNDE